MAIRTCNQTLDQIRKNDNVISKNADAISIRDYKRSVAEGITNAKRIGKQKEDKDLPESGGGCGALGTEDPRFVATWVKEEVTCRLDNFHKHF